MKRIWTFLFGHQDAYQSYKAANAGLTQDEITMAYRRMFNSDEQLIGKPWRPFAKIRAFNRCAMTNRLPENLPGHWETPDGAEMAATYATRERAQLCGGFRTDMVVANRIALLRRDDPNFEVKLTMAKDRIRWLSVQLALANARAAASQELNESTPGALR